MRNRIGIGLVMVGLLITSVSAQSHVDLVTQVKTELQAHGVDLSGPCGAFAITKRVAWRLRTEGAGLLSKPVGNNCDGYAVDYVVYQTGHGADILGDAGNLNIPSWSEDSDPSFSTRWRPAIDPGDVPNPGPVVPIPNVDLSTIVNRLDLLQVHVDAISGQVSAHEAAEQAEREQAEAFRESVRTQWRRAGRFLMKYAPVMIGVLFAGRATK